MHDTIAPAHRIATTVPPRALTRRVAARQALERNAHGLVLMATDDGVPAQWADWWYDLRRRRLHIYGGLLRYIDTASRKLPKSVLRLIPEWIASYIDDQYPDSARR